MNDALRGGLVVGLLGLVPDLLRPHVVAGVDSPVKASGEVFEMSAHRFVLLVLSAALLVTLGRCGHALAPFMYRNGPDQKNVTHVVQEGNRDKICRCKASSVRAISA